MPSVSKTFPLDPTKPGILVDVLLEGPHGQQVVRMVLDTGATYTIAPPSVLRAIGYDPVRSPTHVEFVAAGGVERKPVVTVQAIAAFGIRITKLQVVCHNLPPQSPVRGLLGLNFIKHVSLHLAFPHRRLRLKKTG